MLHRPSDVMMGMSFLRAEAVSISSVSPQDPGQSWQIGAQSEGLQAGVC